VAHASRNWIARAQFCSTAMMLSTLPSSVAPDGRHVVLDEVARVGQRRQQPRDLGRRLVAERPQRGRAALGGRRQRPASPPP